MEGRAQDLTTIGPSNRTFVTKHSCPGPPRACGRGLAKEVMSSAAWVPGSAQTCLKVAGPFPWSPVCAVACRLPAEMTPVVHKQPNTCLTFRKMCCSGVNAAGIARTPRPWEGTRACPGGDGPALTSGASRRARSRGATPRAPGRQAKQEPGALAQGPGRLPCASDPTALPPAVPGPAEGLPGSLEPPPPPARQAPLSLKILPGSTGPAEPPTADVAPRLLRAPCLQSPLLGSAPTSASTHVSVLTAFTPTRGR